MSKLFDDASLAMIPSAYKDGKLYSIRPIPEYGAELVTNGDFDTNSDWTLGTGWSIGNGVCSYNDTATNTKLSQGLTILANTTYRISFTISNASTFARFQIGDAFGYTDYIGTSNYVNGTYNLSFTNAGSYNSFAFTAYSDGSLFDITNISVKEVLVADGDFDFSRGSNLAATRVDVNGLIEKGRENLLLQSNQFDTTWTLNNSSITGGQSGYDGTNNAWLHNITGFTCCQHIAQSISTSGVNTFSVYVKSGTAEGCLLFGLGSGNPYAEFDLITGTKGRLYATAFDSKIESVGGGWYRCSMSFTGSITQVRIYPADASGGISQTSGNIYIQDAQLESGLVSTSVIETGASTAQAGILEDMPRLDYSGGATCPSLLLEPQRSNLVVQSEYFDGWNKISSPTITNNYGISPEGLRNSTRFQTSVGRLTQSVTTINANETFSIYMKGSGTLRMEIGSDNFYPSVTSEWVRYEFKTTQAGGNSNIQIRGNGSAVDVELYGAQYERNSYPTSYIPTYGVSQTRLADACEKTSVSDLIGQTEGTIFAEFTPSSDLNTEVFQLLATNSIENVVTIACGGGKIYGVVYTNSSYVANFSISQTIPNNTFKVALRYENNDIALFINGQKVASNTNAYSGQADLTKILFNNQFLFGKQIVSYKKTLVFKTSLTDSECIALTTL